MHINYSIDSPGLVFGFFKDSAAFELASFETQTVLFSSEIQKSILGAALYAEGCFESQQNNQVTPKNTSTATSTRAPSSGTPGQPQNNFKSRGPLSNVAVDLIAAPNQKIQLTAPIFTVYGFNSNEELKIYRRIYQNKF